MAAAFREKFVSGYKNFFRFGRVFFCSRALRRSQRQDPGVRLVWWARAAANAAKVKLSAKRPRRNKLMGAHGTTSGARIAFPPNFPRGDLC